MLALAEVGPSDVVYDLGCGDGRIVIEAAKRYGARGVGVELDPQRLAEAKARARQEGVEHLVEFRRQDARTLDLSAATVVTLFLLLSSNLKLRPLLEAQLRPGSRIVSRRFGMADWTPERTAAVPIEAGASDTLFLWRL